MVVRSGGVRAPATRRAMSATPPFAPLPTAPGLARGHVRATLAQWGLGELADTAEMIASELTANAVNASAILQAAVSVPVIRLCLITDGETLVVECWDRAPGFPSLRHASEFAETGRGLAIIDSLTSGSWGWQPANGYIGKCVWAEIPAHGLPVPALTP
jgi:anti-sigma regulatory factor (Ser/Thr protein kinase)